jgi:hypothetical protein
LAGAALVGPFYRITVVAKSKRKFLSEYGFEYRNNRVLLLVDVGSVGTL